MGVEMTYAQPPEPGFFVMPREGHGSRNRLILIHFQLPQVMPREGHGSRNCRLVTISRHREDSHAPRGAWE